GCGPNSPLLRFDQFELGVGLDVSRSNLQKMARECRDKNLNKISLVLGNIGYLPFKDNTFNVIGMRDVLEHVDNIPDAINQLSKSMKKGSKLILTTTNIL